MNSLNGKDFMRTQIESFARPDTNRFHLYPELNFSGVCVILLETFTKHLHKAKLVYSAT